MRGCHTALFPERKVGRKSHAKDSSRVFGMIAEPTGTDGLRMLSHQCSFTLLLLTGSSCKDCSHWNNCLAVFLLSSPHNNMRVHVSLTIVSHRKHGQMWYAASVNTTNPCARLPLSTACPTKLSDVSFVLLATTEQDNPLSSPLPVPGAVSGEVETRQHGSLLRGRTFTTEKV